MTVFFHTQLVEGSPIEVTLAKPVDKDSYVRYTRGTGGRGSSLLQTDYTAYTLGQVKPSLIPNTSAVFTLNSSNFLFTFIYLPFNLHFGPTLIMAFKAFQAKSLQGGGHQNHTAVYQPHSP